MGFRMSIEHCCIDYGNDHKLYAYVPLKDLSSFSIILPEIKKQWDDLKDCDLYTIYYGYICPVQYTGELILDEVTFSRFADAYLIDFEKKYGRENLNVFYYMNKLKHLSGDKILSWG